MASPAATAGAALVVKKDNSGRTITFDVVAASADVDWYAAVLSGAAHGDEISGVTIRIVSPSRITSYCGAGAVGCYRRGSSNVITVGVGDTVAVAASLLHEYGHHLDASWSGDSRGALDGTPAWRAARGISALLGAGTVALDYSLGWSRSVGEIFAEDYAYIHLGLGYSIPWLAPPDDALKAAVLTELGATIGGLPAMRATAAAPAAVVTRSGALAAGGRRVLGFDPDTESWHAAVTATVSARAALVLSCGGAVVARRTIASRAAVTVEHGGSGAARCSAALISMSHLPQTYSLRVRYAATPSA